MNLFFRPSPYNAMQSGDNPMKSTMEQHRKTSTRRHRSKAKCNERIVIGIDPGLRITGYGVVGVIDGAKMKLHDAGLVTMPTHKPLPMRLLELYEGVVGLLDEFHPAVVVIEELFTKARYPRTALLMGHARGTICIAVAQRKVPIVGYTFSSVKRTLTGSGRAPRQQLHRSLCYLLRLNRDAPIVRSPDAMDALALAVCHILNEGLSKDVL